MKPIKFTESNKTLGPPIKQDYSENVEGIDPLAVWTDKEQCVSCWKLSFRERLSALIFGRAWLSVLSGETQPPVFIVISRSYFLND